MNLEEIYEEVLPYLSNPKEVRDFLDEHKESSLEEIIKDINVKIGGIEASLKTDFRILLNAFEKPR
jgi:hypothetical protein